MSLLTNTVQGIDPSTGRALEPAFAVSSIGDVAEASRRAAAAFDTYRELAPESRAAFLETIAGNLEARGEDLIARAIAESGLPRARLTGELGRTTGQLRMFARVVREGNWAGVTMDKPLPDRQPIPRPDLRQRKIALGPVAVFGASNFPLAFSVAGGDTASALAAGCPVVVKGHPAHPGTSALAGDAIREAVATCKLPEGVFSLLQGPSNELGATLVADPRIKGVGFTGSRAGGLALVAIAQHRPEPIPVYAEMSSVNPVVLLPAALEMRAEAIAKSYVASLTMGAGQFCTNPGIVLAIEGPNLDRFITAAADALGTVASQVMLTAAIHANYNSGVAKLETTANATLVARGPSSHPDPSTSSGEGPPRASRQETLGRAALFITDGRSFRSSPELANEIFGASSLIVRCTNLEEIAVCLKDMEGQLTATVQADEADHPAARTLLPLLETKVGRILINGWPTGVEVSRAMVHGGPYPATSDSRTTSVGAAAIERFLRIVCYQDIPDDILPAPLKDGNPWNLPRAIFD
jgi:alpha-ketoglutaric semialdehyde dehydrogenase